MSVSRNEVDELLWSLRRESGVGSVLELARHFERGTRGYPQGTVTRPFEALIYQTTLQAARTLTVKSDLQASTAIGEGMITKFERGFHDLVSRRLKQRKAPQSLSVWYSRVFFWLAETDVELLRELAASDPEQCAARLTACLDPAVERGRLALKYWFGRACLVAQDLEPPYPCTWSDVAREALFVLESARTAQRAFEPSCSWWNGNWTTLTQVRDVVWGVCTRLNAHLPAVLVAEVAVYSSTSAAEEVTFFLLLVERYLNWNVPWPFFAVEPSSSIRYPTFDPERYLEWLARSAALLENAVPGVWDPTNIPPKTFTGRRR